MTTLRIKVTKSVIEESKYCTADKAYHSCAIWRAVKDVLPDCAISKNGIYTDLSMAHTIPLPSIAKEFIRVFDVSSIEQRLAMDEIEFEIEIPDEVIEKINIEELRPLLVNHPTLELV